MRLRKIRRTNHTNNGWKVIRRCVIFFTAICLVPVFLVFMVATDHYYARPRIPLNHPIGSELIQLDQHHRSRNNVSMFVLKRLEQRRTHLRKTCHLLGLDKIGNDTLHTPNSWEYLVDEKHHLIWCNVFKAASTSWMYNFNILAGYSPTFLRRSRTPPLTLARKKYGRPSLEFLRKAFRNKKSLSFLIVRHPLERLLSAYRDKIKYAVSGSYHFKLGKEIIKNYRKIVFL
ncbi:hypothetical protein ABEB36_006409 [Hypothenemus hampei]|uniref:Carbohydrate sulfotransferase n=1 Tax=Hypothenemus hampei TaxID=57062 RepID=A0ABD1EQF1_HYPHA